MHRVVVTGIGLISPLGLTLAESWEGLTKGRTGIGPITLFDTTGFDVNIAAEVKNFDPAALLGHRAARRMDRFEQLGNVAAREALQHSGLEITEANAHRV